MIRRGAGLQLQGSLAHLSVLDLVQFLEVARKSGAIRLRSPAESGTLWIREGAVVDAQTDHLCGRDAALELLSWTAGTFEVELRAVDRDGAIGEPTASLLMTAMVAVDEARRATDPATTQVPTAPKQRFHPAWLLGALALGFAIPFWKVGGGSGRAQADVRVARPTVESAPAALVLTETTAPPDPIPQEALAHRILVVEAWPDDVEVWVAGRLRATHTPARIDLGRLTGAIEVRVSRDGFRDWVIEIGPNEGWNVVDGEVVRVVRPRMRERPLDVVATAPEAAVP